MPYWVPAYAKPADVHMAWQLGLVFASKRPAKKSSVREDGESV
jgi:hypothetical protein